MLASATRHLAQILGGDARWSYDDGRPKVIASYPRRHSEGLDEVMIVALAESTPGVSGVVVDKVAARLILGVSGRGEMRGRDQGVMFERTCSNVVHKRRRR